MTSVTLVGTFRATADARGTSCILVPDPGQLPEDPGYEKLVLFRNTDFAEMMQELGIRMRYGTSVLLEGPCRVHGSLNTQELPNGDCVLQDISALEISTTTFSYVPNRIYSVSYVINLSGSSRLSLCEIEQTNTFDLATLPVGSRRQIRGYLVADPLSEKCWLSPAQEDETEVPSQPSIKLPNSMALIVKNYLTRRIDRQSINDTLPVYAGWATVEGTLVSRSEEAVFPLSVEEIVVISIPSGRLLRKIWWDPTLFEWHTQ